MLDERELLETEILEAAITKIQRGTGLEIRVLERENMVGKHHITDAVLKIVDRDITLFAEIKQWMNQINFGALVNHLTRIVQGRREDVILIADYINPNIAEKLKKEGIQYIDTAGNAYIDQRPLYIFIKGNKAGAAAIKSRKVVTGRAFQTAGLKVVYELLRDRYLVEAPYRVIADTAGVALGNIGAVLDDLMARRYIEDKTYDKRRVLTRYKRILDEWVNAYPIKLLNKLRIGLFTTDDAEWWKKINPTEYQALWGGEIAAAKHTNFLNPKDGTVYINKRNLNMFITRVKLRKYDPQRDDGYRVDVREMFWKPDQAEIETGITNPLITYADLIATGETRNLEVAERLREKINN